MRAFLQLWRSGAALVAVNSLLVAENEKQWLLLLRAQALGFQLHGLQQLQLVGSVVVVPGLQNTGSVAAAPGLQNTGSVYVAHGLNYSEACGSSQIRN